MAYAGVNLKIGVSRRSPQDFQYLMKSVDVEEDEVDLPLALVQLDQHQIANQKAGNVEESVDDNRTVEQYRRFDFSVDLKCLLMVLSP
jgi:hypothetical protein